MRCWQDRLTTQVEVGGNNTPDDGRFLGSKSFDLGEEEDWQDLDIAANDWNF